MFFLLLLYIHMFKVLWCFFSTFIYIFNYKLLFLSYIFMITIKMSISSIYAFSRRFYPKRLTVHSGYTFFGQYMCSLGIEPTTFAQLTQCSNHWATGTLQSNCNLYFGKPWFNCSTFPVNFLLEGEGDATFPSLDCFWSNERSWLTEKTNT